jgi:2-phospho-L-lactate guanylyltransferase (CobY/MobA/RfbA family)
MRPPTATLLVFTLGAAAERSRRRLLPGALEGMELGLRQACLEGTLEAGAACALRLEVCSPERLPLPAGAAHVPQAGDGFGERLERALHGALERAGRGPVLVVGSDVPGLGPRHLADALAHLADDPRRVVLGPSPDGGFYLIAAAAPIPGLAGAARWCRRDTLAALRRSLAAGGREVVLLEPLADLDRPADLDAWLATAGSWSDRWRMLATLLRRALAERRRPVLPRQAAAPRGLPAVLASRAPPADLYH